MLIPPLLFVPIVYFFHLTFRSTITSSIIPYFWVVWLVVFSLEGLDQRNGKRAIMTGFTMLFEFIVIGIIAYYIGTTIPFGTLLAGSPVVERTVSVIGTSIVLAGLAPIDAMFVFGQINYAYIGVVLGSYAIAGYLSGYAGRMRRRSGNHPVVNPLSEDRPQPSTQDQTQPSTQPSYIA